MPLWGAAQFFSYTDQEATFPGGEKAIALFLHDSIIYPAQDIANGTYGKLVPSIYIDATGVVVKVEVPANLTESLSEQTRIALLKLPRFNPAYNKGKAVGYILKTPIALTIDEYTKARSNKEWPAVLLRAQAAAQLKKDQQQKVEDSVDAIFTPEQKAMNNRELNTFDKYQTKICDMRLNYVQNRVHDFLRNSIKVFGENDGEYYRGNPRTMTYKYDKLKIKYVVDTTGGEFIIRSCDISGDIYAAINFYVFFWNTKLQFENLKEGELVSNYLWNERIALLPNLRNKTALITIRVKH